MAESTHGPEICLRTDLNNFNFTYLEAVKLRNPKTAEDHGGVLKKFFAVNGFRNEQEAIEKLRKGGADSAIFRFIAYLKQPKPNKPRGLSSRTINQYVSVVRAWLEYNEIPYNRIKIRKALPQKKEEKDSKPLPKNLVKTLIQLLHPSKRLAAWTLFACGLRISEAVRLRVRDLDLNSDPPRLYVQDSKTPAGRRVVFIPRDLAEKLREAVKDKPSDYPVFPSMKDPRIPMHHQRLRVAIYGALKRLGELKRDRSGRGYVYHPHCLRSAFETELRNAGMDKSIVDILMGHRLGIDQHYFKPTEEQLAREWLKYEKFLRLDVEAEPREMMIEFERERRKWEDQLRERDEAIKTLFEMVKRLSSQVEGLAKKAVMVYEANRRLAEQAAETNVKMMQKKVKSRQKAIEITRKKFEEYLDQKIRRGELSREEAEKLRRENQDLLENIKKEQKQKKKKEVKVSK